jgi:hypothetical protein
MRVFEESYCCKPFWSVWNRVAQWLEMPSLNENGNFMFGESQDLGSPGHASSGGEEIRITHKHRVELLIMSERLCGLLLDDPSYIDACPIRADGALARIAPVVAGGGANLERLVKGLAVYVNGHDAPGEGSGSFIEVDPALKFPQINVGPIYLDEFIVKNTARAFVIIPEVFAFGCRAPTITEFLCAGFGLT